MTKGKAFAFAVISILFSSVQVDASLIESSKDMVFDGIRSSLSTFKAFLENINERLNPRVPENKTNVSSEVVGESISASRIQVDRSRKLLNEVENREEFDDRLTRAQLHLMNAEKHYENEEYGNALLESRKSSSISTDLLDRARG